MERNKNQLWRPVIREPFVQILTKIVLQIWTMVCKRFGVPLQRPVWCLLFMLVPYSSSLPNLQMNAKQNESRNQLVKRYRTVARDTTGLLSSDWPKISLIFRIQSVARLWRGQRFLSLEKNKRNVLYLTE